MVNWKNPQSCDSRHKTLSSDVFYPSKIRVDWSWGEDLATPTLAPSPAPHLPGPSLAPVSCSGPLPWPLGASYCDCTDASLPCPLCGSIPALVHVMIYQLTLPEGASNVTHITLRSLRAVTSTCMCVYQFCVQVIYITAQFGTCCVGQFSHGNS